MSIAFRGHMKFLYYPCPKNVWVALLHVEPNCPHETRGLELSRKIGAFFLITQVIFEISNAGGEHTKLLKDA